MDNIGYIYFTVPVTVVLDWNSLSGTDGYLYPGSILAFGGTCVSQETGVYGRDSGDDVQLVRSVKDITTKAMYFIRKKLSFE